MPLHKPRSLGSLDPSCSPRPAPIGTTIADVHLSKDQTRPELLQRHDPPTIYVPFLDTSFSTGNNENDTPCNIESRSLQQLHSDNMCNVGEPVSTAPLVQPNVTARFANKSTRSPLATIIEQRSHSESYSYTSLHECNGRKPLVQPTPRIQPTTSSQRISRTLDESARYRIQERTNHNHRAAHRIGDHANLLAGPELSCTGPHPDTPITNVYRRSQLPTLSQCQRLDHDGDMIELKGLRCDGMQHVHGAPWKTGSGPYVLKTPSTETLSEPATMLAQCNLLTGVPNSEQLSTAHLQDENGCLGPVVGPEMHVRDTAEHFSAARNCNSSSSGSFHCQVPTIRHICPEREDDDAITYTPEHRQLQLPRSNVHDQCRPLENGPSRMSTLQYRGREDYMVKYTWDGLPVYRDNAPSLCGYDLAREPSLCSISSSSYSGTVLGIDLDLHQDFPPASRRISASYQSRQDPVKDRASRVKSSRTIVSSALPALLPVAAASGIIKLSHSMPSLSFYSPSGKLIRAESPSSQLPSPARDQDIPYSFHAPPAQISMPVPVTTPLRASAPLSSHLKPRRRQRADNSVHSNAEPPTPVGVKVCGGEIRRDSFTPRSGVRTASLEAMPESHHVSNRYSLSICSGLASRVPARSSKMASCIHFPRGGMLGPCEGGGLINKVLRPRRKDTRGTTNASSDLGPLAAWMLRVCFCQPYDGAGYTRTRRTRGRCSQCGVHGLDRRDNAHTDFGEDVENMPPRIISHGRQDSLMES